MEIRNRIELLIFIMSLISEKFRSQAVLRGGMALYLLHSKRYTNDLDYAFVPYKSKNEIVKPILELLETVKDLEVTHNLNSQCLRIRLQYKGIEGQLEIKTFTSLPSISISTQNLSDVSLPPFITRIASLDWSLSQKLAAWWERRLARDLYDIYFLVTVLGTVPDRAALEERLKKLRCTGRGKNVKKAISLEEFIENLEEAAQTLTFESISQELRDYFSQDEIFGIDLKIRAALNKVVEFLRK